MSHPYQYSDQQVQLKHSHAGSGSCTKTLSASWCFKTPPLLRNSQRSSQSHEEKLTRLRPAKAELKVRVKSGPADRRTHTWVCVTLCTLVPYSEPGRSLQRGPAWAGLNNPKYSLFSGSGKLMASRDRGTRAPPRIPNLPEMSYGDTFCSVQMLFLPVSSPQSWVLVTRSVRAWVWVTACCCCYAGRLLRQRARSEKL